MKLSRNKLKHNDDNIWSSVSDLMSGLMIVFLFISISYMSRVTRETIQIKEQQQAVKKVITTHENIKLSIYKDLQEEFKNDIKNWGIEIDEDGTVRFLEPEVFFRVGSAELKPRFENILNDFFPRYINIVHGKYKDNIEEVRIEGYTSSEWGENVTLLESYFCNMELSQDRTRNVLSYIMNLESIKPYHEWLIEHITANGMSYSHREYDENDNEDEKASRRVEFKIRTNAEQVMSDIITKYSNDKKRDTN
ncbi:OmpA family protein [Tepidibacter hydrothermalis]|uniref:OmpA family protein n=1 Tax=Tepidibacter hydrothermalis TaxID=3036126 RepID=A0ABY8E7Z8_9FIRM|nr:OmpA family protein [Tepidibacter hydrothermalis]WFD09023.1 OmpA family protein [Tepidibacter hydrothermalis]